MFLLMLLWLPQVFSAVSRPPAPVNVNVESAHFNHVLRWDRGAGTPPGVTYNVTFRADRGTYCQVVHGCESVVAPLVCNLTADLSDPEETYHIQVTAQPNTGESSTSIRDFTPIRDTELDPPVLRVARCDSALCVDMDAPLPDLRSIYDLFEYELKVQKSTSLHSPTEATVQFKSLQRQRFPGLVAGSQYCVSVRFNDKDVPRHSNFSSPHCVHVPSPFSATEYLLAALLCIATLVILLGVFLLYWTGFFGLRKSALPSVLNSVYHSEEPMDALCHPSDSSLLNVEAVAPPNGRTSSCSSYTDSSEDEEDVKHSADRGGAIALLYRAEVSFSSSRSTGPSTNQSAVSTEVRPEEPEEVNLLTLTFGKDTVERTHSPGIDPEPPVCALTEEDEEVEEVEDEEEDEEEYDTQTGYMRR